MFRTSGVLLVYCLSLLTLCNAQSSTTTSTADRTAPTTIGKVTYVPVFENQTYTFILNETRPVYQANFPSVTGALEAIVNIEKYGPQGQTVRAFASTEAPRTTEKQSYDSASGGTWAGEWNKFHAPATWELAFDRGFANWTTGVDKKGVVKEHEPHGALLVIGRGIKDDLGLEAAGGGDVVVTLTFFMYNVTAGTRLKLDGLDSTPPLFGDSTATEALVFSPVQVDFPIPQPTYPNYTLPGAALSLPSTEEIPANYTNTFVGRDAANVSLLIIRTDALGSALEDLDLSASAVWKAWNNWMTGPQPPQVIRSGLQWTTIGHKQGFRNYIFVNNLQPDKNYTVWAVSDDRKFLSAPAFFRTKEQTFTCPILMPTDLCPGIGYATPISTASGPIDAIPEDLAEILTTNLQAFSASLLTSACGRDHFSFVSSCLDCYNAYRDWLCRIVLPQCASTNSLHPLDEAAPFKIPRNDTSRRNADISYAQDYTELLPCMSTCNQVDRACPVSLGFICPRRNFNANESYAFFTKDNAKGDGSVETGRPGLDRWGWRWCNN